MKRVGVDTSLRWKKKGRIHSSSSPFFVFPYENPKGDSYGLFFFSSSSSDPFFPNEQRNVDLWSSKDHVFFGVDRIPIDARRYSTWFRVGSTMMSSLDPNRDRIVRGRRIDVERATRL